MKNGLVEGSDCVFRERHEFRGYWFTVYRAVFQGSGSDLRAGKVVERDRV